ncbi:MAG: helix-turn-helix domain-containing protein [Alphaproteobacteria bacterium]|nr:helix-turn-helix domain-containing protein [Alphaproteobacteria bacterium]
MESAAKIRRLVRDGRSIQSVSRSTGLSRNTIKKYLKDATPPKAPAGAPGTALKRDRFICLDPERLMIGPQRILVYP